MFVLPKPFKLTILFLRLGTNTLAYLSCLSVTKKKVLCHWPTRWRQRTTLAFRLRRPSRSSAETRPGKHLRYRQWTKLNDNETKWYFGTAKLSITIRKMPSQHNYTQHYDIQLLCPVSLCWVSFMPSVAIQFTTSGFITLIIFMLNFVDTYIFGYFFASGTIFTTLRFLCN